MRNAFLLFQEFTQLFELVDLIERQQNFSLQLILSYYFGIGNIVLTIIEDFLYFGFILGLFSMSIIIKNKLITFSKISFDELGSPHSQ